MFAGKVCEIYSVKIEKKTKLETKIKNGVRI